MSTSTNFDVIIIGSGPGGVKAAIHAANAGLRTALVEREPKVGGACVYQGTIPSKTLREAALTIVNLKRNAAAFNVTLREDLEVASLMTRLDRVLQSHSRIIRDQLDSQGIQCFHGRASFLAPQTLQVMGVSGALTLLQAKNIVIASGSRPRCPAEIPIDHEHILDSDSILSMIYLPRSLTVLGGGVIACEYASIFSLLGVKVTVIDKAPRPLFFLDPELTAKFVSNFERHGGRYLGEQQVESVEWDSASQVRTRLKSGQVLTSDKMLVALGRSANLEGLNLPKVGINLSQRGHIQVNEHFQTNLSHVYAVGDVIGPPALAACAMEQGRRAICHILNTDPGHSFDVVPMGIYAVPELASVGLTEDQARQQYGGVTVGRALFEELARGQISGIQDGLLKLVADPFGKKLLGVQVVGDGAADLVHLGQMALINNDEVSVFLENIFNFPTLGEAYRVAALDLLRNVQQQLPILKAA